MRPIRSRDAALKSGASAKRLQIVKELCYIAGIAVDKFRLSQPDIDVK